MFRFIPSSILLFLLISVSVSAQSYEPGGRLSYKSSFWSGNKFYYDGLKVNADGVERIMRSNTEALELLRQGNKQANGASVVGGIGGFLIGWPIGTAIAGGDPAWELAGVGAGISVISAIIYSSANKKIKRSIELYNAGTPSSYSMPGVIREINLMVRPAEVGLSFTF